MEAERQCAWCGGEIPPKARVDALVCSSICRKRVYRLRRRRETAARYGAPMRLAYADPPYPKRAYRYRDQPTYAGEVDHRELVERLIEGWPDGWALSTSQSALRELLPLCPKGVHVCPWVKPLPPRLIDRGLSNRWEVLLVVGGRQAPPGVRDWLLAAPDRTCGATLVGRKPIAFCAFLFDALGMVPGDTLDDLYPGTGVVGRAWAAIGGEPSPEYSRDAPLEASRNGYPSPGARVDSSPVPRGHGYASLGADGPISGKASPSAGGYGYGPPIRAVDLSEWPECFCPYCSL